MTAANAYTGRKVLVTGADGFIGSHLAEALVEAGAEVTALSLYESFGSHGWLDELPEDRRAALDIVRGDVRDPGFTMRLMAGHEIVFHLAALITIPYSYVAAQSYVDVNVSGTVNVLEAARAHGVARLVHTSTSEVYGTAQLTPIPEDHPLHGQSPYAASKIAADMMAEAYFRSFELPVVILRPFNTYGPRQSERGVIATAIRQALDPACDVIRLGDLTPKRDFNYIADMVASFLRAGRAADLEYGAPYNSGSGEAVSVADMVDLVVGLTGCNKPVEQEAERLRPERSEVRELCADASRFRAATGWRPRVDLGEGLAHTIDWWRGRIERGVVRPTTEFMI